MSNSTRPGGYDERLVVPLEASRRGAHRARTNPLVAALPLLAVVLVVAAVIGVSYTLFLRDTGDTTADPGTPGTSQQPTAAPTTSPEPGDAPSATPSAPDNSSSSPAAPAATANKASVVTAYNNTTISGLAKRASNALVAAGWPKATFTTAKWPVAVTQTTIFYSKDSQKATAEAVAKSLRVGTAEKTTRDTGAGVALVLGPDAGDVVPG